MFLTPGLGPSTGPEALHLPASLELRAGGRVRTLASWALGLGFLVSIAAYSGWLSALGPSLMSTAVVVGSVAVVGGGVVLGGMWLYDLYRGRFPTTELRDAMVADAMALGLRSVGRDLSTLDLRFPLFQKRKGHFLTQSLTATLASADRPRVDWIFAGSWRGREVRIFDYTDVKQDDAKEWTCDARARAVVAFDLHYAARLPDRSAAAPDRSRSPLRRRGLRPRLPGRHTGGGSRDRNT